MEYIKDNEGELKTMIVRTSEKKDLDILEKLSSESNAKIYLIPDDTDYKLDEKGWLRSVTGNTEGIWQFIKGWSMPYETFVNGFPFPVKMEEMWKSDKNVEEVGVDELRWNLKLPWWSTDDIVPYNLTPEEVLNDINKFLDHKDRIENSDIKYPLLLVQTKQDRWLIYDGVHRFVRQILEGKQSVFCQKFKIDEMEEHVRESYLELFNEWEKLEYINA